MARNTDLSVNRVNAILEAARDLFYLNGYANTPVAEIAEEAGVAAGTIIYHFKSKENLLFILSRQFLSGMLARTHRHLGQASGPRQTIEGCIDAFFEHVDANRKEFVVASRTDWYRVMANDAEGPQAELRIMLSRYVSLLDESIERGVRQAVFAPSALGRTGLVLFSLLNCAGRLPVLLGISLDEVREEVKRFASARLEHAPGEARPDPGRTQASV